MKKQLPIILLLSFFTAALSGQVERMVLIEEFTNASCAPCAGQNPAFNQLLSQNEDGVISIKYQTEFPGFDPYNQQNPDEVATRRSLYQVTGVPTASIDGVVPGNNYGGGGLSTWIDPQGNGYDGGPYGYNQAVLDYAETVPTTIGVDVSAEVPNFDEIGTVEVQITNADTVAFTDNSRIFVVLVERENQWPEPPGTTNEAEFFNVMRKMYPNANGIDLGTIPADTTVTVEVDVMLPDYLYNLSELSFIAFVQNQTDRSIYNADMTERLPVPAVYPNIAFTQNSSAAEGGLCDRIFTGEIEVSNLGSTPISEFDLLLNNNGSNVATQTITDTLEASASSVISFDPIELEGGLSNFTFSIDNVNGANAVRIVNALGTVSETISAQSAEQTDETEISYSLESDPPNTTAPAGLILDNPGSFMQVVSRNSFQNPPGAVGGYGNSEQSLFINFYQWNPQSVGSNRGDVILAREFTLNPNASELLITFDRAHAQYNNPNDPNDPNSNDGLEGYISYDCGENWTRVYAKGGSDLSTTSPIGPLYVPSANQWATDSISIEVEPGETTALFKFEAVSGWGNSLYLDNIKAEGAEIVSSVDPVIFDTQPTVYPNPSVGQSTLQFEVSERQRMNITLYNAMGQPTHTIADRDFAAGTYRMPLTLGQQSNGMYRIVFTTADGTQSIPFILSK
jgi:hypothetical protein